MPGAAPFLTACYIVKDEEDVLAASLDAVAPFVDEVVVYDTGSTDRTMEVARSHGARVVEGFWDDDFGAARNRALGHCRSPWIISVDADEQAHGDPVAFRDELRRTSAQQFHVVVDSDQLNSGHGIFQSLAARVFRRARFSWVGVLHEQLVASGKPRRITKTEHLALSHVGYTPLRWQERGKSDRNVHLAEVALRRAEDQGVEDLSKLLMDVARSHAAADDHQAALDHFQRIDRDIALPSVVAGSAQAAFMSALTVGDHAAAAGWVEALEALALSPVTCQVLRGQLAMATGDLDSALELFSTLQDGTDVYGLPMHAAGIAGDLAMVHVLRGRYDEAMAALLPAIEGGHVTPPLNTLLALAEVVPNGFGRLAAVLSPTLIKEYAAQARRVDPADADVLLEAMHGQGRETLTVLVSAASIATELDVRRALVWSARLREAGFGEHCPLRAILRDEQREARDRVIAGAMLVEAGDGAAVTVLEPLLAGVEDGEAVLGDLRTLTPRFAAMLVHV